MAAKQAAIPTSRPRDPSKIRRIKYRCDQHDALLPRSLLEGPKISFSSCQRAALAWGAMYRNQNRNGMLQRPGNILPVRSVRRLLQNYFASLWNVRITCENVN